MQVAKVIPSSTERIVFAIRPSSFSSSCTDIYLIMNGKPLSFGQMASHLFIRTKVNEM